MDAPDKRNLTAENFLAKANQPINLPTGIIRIHDEYHLASNLLAMSAGRETTNFVLMVHQHNVVAITMLHNKIFIYDSHQHAQHGALVAYAGIEHLHEFCSYLNRIFKQHFISSINGGNLAQIDFIL